MYQVIESDGHNKPLPAPIAPTLHIFRNKKHCLEYLATSIMNDKQFEQFKDSGEAKDHDGNVWCEYDSELYTIDHR